MKKENREDKEFVREFTYESNDHKVSAIFQPYLLGMYAAITDSKISQLIQLNLFHREMNSWIKRLFAKFESEGMEQKSLTKCKYTDFFTEDVEELKEFEVI